MSKYISYSSDQMEEHLSHYLAGSWSYSGVCAFARNEKAFEMNYIYNERSKRSASSVAGNAYHRALELYFNDFNYKKDGIQTSIVDMERVAFMYIDKITANEWKLQKGTPSVAKCIEQATKTTITLIKNFVDDVEVYISEISEVLGVELRLDEWITVNGVDIPLPCHMVVDLIVRLKSGEIAIIDHKSKATYTDDKEMSFSSGKQAMTYVKGYEAKTGNKVGEVWFIENKSSMNKDGSPQTKKFKIILDANTRKLYEAMLYEHVKRMIEAVSNPDYVYLINDNDNFIDRAELYEFWMKTLIAEVDDFNILPEKRDLIEKRQKKIRDASLAAVNPKTIAEFRKNASEFILYDLSNKNMDNSQKIEHILRTFKILINVAHNIQGYSSDTFLLEAGAGVKIANIVKFKLDIANALNVSDVRVGSKLMVYEDKSYLPIEVSKKRTEDLLFDPKYLDGEKLPIGVDNFGRTIIWDLNSHATPHMLVCGATGSGKSVSLISTIEYAKLAGVTDIVIFDPKYEFCDYGTGNTRVYNEIEEIEEQMAELVSEMHVRAKSRKKHKKVLVVFDEFADAVSSARKGKALGGLRSLEENLKALLQKGRSLGFRVIAATQRASVNVITGDAKVNFPIQICFRVPKEIDSKVVLDEAGAETLAGMGDGLMKSPEYMDVIRFQGFYKP